MTTWSKLVCPELAYALKPGDMLDELDELDFDNACQISTQDLDPQLQESAEGHGQLQSQAHSDLGGDWCIDVNGESHHAESQSRQPQSWCTPANGSQMFKIETGASESTVPGNQMLYEEHDYASNNSNNVSQVSLSYGTSTPVDDFDFTAMEFDPSQQSQACFSNDVYPQDWPQVENVWDPSLVVPVSGSHSVYPTPPTAMGFDKFPSFDIQCPTQAEAGASLAIKREQ